MSKLPQKYVASNIFSLNSLIHVKNDACDIYKFKHSYKHHVKQSIIKTRCVLHGKIVFYKKQPCNVKKPSAKLSAKKFIFACKVASIKAVC